MRVDEDLKKLVRDIVEKTNVTETALVEATLKALCDYFEEHGEITLPLVVIPKSALKKTSARAAIGAIGPSHREMGTHGLNEPEGDYKTAKRKPKESRK